MLQIPRYDEQVVESRGVSGVKVTNTPDTGEGLVADAIGGVGQFAGDIGQQMQEDVDAAKLTEVFAGASDRIRKVMQEDILARKGEQSFTAAGEVDKIHEDIAREAKAGLRNERQRAAFDGLWARQREGNLNQTYRHIAGEKELYKKNAAIVGAKAAIDDVAADYDSPEDIARHIDRGRKFTIANLQGQDPAVIKEAEEAFISDAHATVIDRLVIANPTKAREYYKANKKQIGGLQRDRIEKLIESESLREESQLATDKIMLTIKDPKKQIEAARKFTGEKRDEVVRRVKTRQQEERVAKAQIKTDLIEQAGRIIVGGGSLDDLKPEHREALGVSGIASMRRFIKSNIEGSEVELDAERYYALLDLSVSDPKQFLKETERLITFVGFFPKKELEVIDRLRRSLSKGSTKDTSLLGTKNEIVKKSLWEFKNGKPSEKEMMEFRIAVDEEIEAQGVSKDDPEWRNKVQAITDKLLIVGEERGSVWGKDKPYYKSEKEKFYLDDIDRIPEKTAEEIRRWLERIGESSTDEDVIREYMEMKGLNQ